MSWERERRLPRTTRGPVPLVLGLLLLVMLLDVGLLAHAPSVPSPSPGSLPRSTPIPSAIGAPGALPPSAGSASAGAPRLAPPTSPIPAGPTTTVVTGASLLATIDVGGPVGGPYNYSQYALPKFEVAYDPGHDLLTVPLFGWDETSVVSDQNDTLTAILRVSDDPLWATYDPQDGDVYVSNHGNTTLSMLNATRVVGTVTVGAGPFESLYDPSNGYLYVMDEGAGSVSVVQGASTVATIGVGTQPAYATYAPNSGDLFVFNSGSGNVSVIHGTSLIGTVAVGSTPYFGAYDASNGFVYVANAGSNNVSILNGTTLVGSVGAGTAPSFAAYDPGDGDVYVTNTGSGSVTVIHGTSVVANLTTGNGSTYIACDPANDQVYVANIVDGTVSILQGTSIVAVVSVGLRPLMFTYDPGNGGFYLPDESSGNLSELGEPTDPYPVTFTEVGLPAGMNWSVQLGSTLYTPPTPAVQLSEPNGTFGYRVPPIAGYYAENGSGTVNVSGSVVRVTVTFVPVYSVDFHESGLPNATSWGVSVGSRAQSSTTQDIDFELPNGTEPYRVNLVPGYHTANETGQVTVDGAALTQPVVFQSTLYPVVFHEDGLPNGTVWQGSIANASLNSSSDEIAFLEPNGSYEYTVGAGPQYFAANASGRIVLQGNGTRLDLQFVPAYVVRFQEVGLPVGTNWSVTIAGTTGYATSATVRLYEPNGTHAYLVGTVPGYTTVGSGVVRVNGPGALVNLTFVPTVYSVRFVELGLPSGARWAVTLGNASQSDATGTVSFSAPNGSYAYSVGRVAGYSPTPRSGTVSVDGAGVLVNVSFERAYPVAFRETGLPTGTAWNVTISPDSNASTSPTIVLEEPNGTHAYSIARVAGFTTVWFGSIRVAGAGANVPVTFEPVEYRLSFRESGLPTGLPWKVSIGSASNLSTLASVSLEEPNGTYTYSVAVIPGFRSNESSGVVTVTGSGRSVDIPFSVTTYRVTFQEEGLADGARWNLTLQGRTQVSMATSMTIPLANGTYPFTVGPPPGYVGPGPGLLVVQGSSPPVVALSFSHAAPSPGFLGLPGSTGYGLVAALAVVAAVAVVYAWRRSHPPAPSEPSPP